MNRRRGGLRGYRRLALYFYHHWHQASRSLADIWHTPLTSLMTIAVIGVSLALPVTFQLILRNAEMVTSQWQGGSQISLYLQKQLDQEAIQALTTQIRSRSDVSEVIYISPEQALEEFNQLSGFAGAMKYLSDNPLPPVLVVTPRPEARNPDAANAMLAELTRDPQVEQGRLDLQWLARLDGIVNLIRHSIQGIAGLLLFGVLLTVANTMRLHILNRRAEIEVMKLVGATDSFIQRPYLYFGFWFGLLGGMLAWWLATVLVLWTEGLVVELAALYDSAFRLTGLGLVDSLLLILLSVLLGMLAAWFSVRRHIREIEPS